MIVKNYSFYQYIHMALPKKMRETMRAYAESCSDWEEGRQGTGYYKTDLKDEGTWHTHLSTLEWALKYLDPSRAYKYEDYDAWLLFYPEGSSVPIHVDPSPKEGYRHKRLNISIINPVSGGTLMLYPPDPGAAILVPFTAPGDGVVFYPSETAHCVSTIDQGRRLVLSIGMLEKI